MNKGCHNCVHRYGANRQYWKCSRVGIYCELEMSHGNKCSKDGNLKYWHPRPNYNNIILMCLAIVIIAQTLFIMFS